MTKTIKEIRSMIEDARPAITDTDGLSGEYSGHKRTLDALHAVLEKLADHESLINRMDGEVAQITDTKRSVPAQWYRSVVHTNLKLTHELGALLQALEGFSDWVPHVVERRAQLLAEDSEYQRLLAEEEPRIVMSDLAGVEPVPHDTSLITTCLALSPDRKSACGLTKGHAFRHSWVEPCESTCDPQGMCQVPHGCLWANGA